MPARPRLAIASLALVGIAGCAEEPGVELRWAIHDAQSGGEVAPLVSVEQCSEVGIERFRLDAYALPRLPSDLPTESLSFPCFPSVFGNPDAYLEGPPLASGDYELELIGLRRNGLEWSCGDELSPLPCARATSELNVSASDPGRAEFTITPPPQCDDGIDNDRDGRVDKNDLGCIFNQGYEGYDFGLVVFQLSVKFLDNPLIEPIHVGITEFIVLLDEVEVTFNTTSDDPLQIPAFSRRLADGEVGPAEISPGEHTLRIIGVDENGTELTTEPAYVFVVGGDDTGFIQHEFVFEPDEFDSTLPLLADWKLPPEFLDHETNAACQSHLLALDNMRARVRVGGGGAAVSPLSFENVTNTADPQGWVEFSCADAAAGSARLQTEDLAWTTEGFELELELRRGTTTCFTAKLERTRPTSTATPNRAMKVTLETVLDGPDDPPDDCIECENDDDCGDLSNLRCNDHGLCVAK